MYHRTIMMISLSTNSRFVRLDKISPIILFCTRLMNNVSVGKQLHFKNIRD